VLRPGQLPGVTAAAARLPSVTFVLDHLGNAEVEDEPDKSWAAAVTAFAALPNSVCKLSGILGEAAGDEAGRPDVSRLRPYFDLAVDSFGPARLMFGSDWPLCTLQARYSDVVTAAVALTSELSAAEQAAILAGTARRVYRIVAARATEPGRRP